MTPQSSFMIVATVDPQREENLRRLLDTMNRELGVIDPHNPLIPFGEMSKVHFARVVILDDATMGDIAVYGLPTINFPKYLAILGDVDGPEETFLIELVQRAADGLRQIFSHCEGYSPNLDLLSWIKDKSVSPAANYVNWIGRTVIQVREEEALRQSLEKFIQENSASLAAALPRQVHQALRRFATAEQQSGRLQLTPQEPTPLGWQVRNAIHLIGIPLLLIVLLPLLLVYLPVFLILLRLREKSDPVIAPRVDPDHANLLALLEDHDVTNQFNALGSIKPGLLRLTTIRAVLLAIDYTARHVFNRGRLARVTTIHFARWVFLDGRKRVIFVSNYDGSLESYMDDFINKVYFGLNVVFSNGISYPRTNWLLLDGARDEQKFKNVLRRHQIPTQAWYNAFPGLTARDRHRNALIRQGLEQDSMTDIELQAWLKLL
jgi:hypothetical protein